MSSQKFHPHLNVGGQVLAAVDASGYTESVCRHAAWAALRLEAPLQFVHAIAHVQPKGRIDLSGNLTIGEQETLLRDLTEADERLSNQAQQEGRLLLQRAKAIAAEAGVADADTRLRHGLLADTLGELEQDVRLFVIGKRGVQHAPSADTVDTTSLGDEIERVVRTVHRPLLVAARDFRPIERVLVAFDGSATTRKGIEMLAASPLLRGCDIHVLTVGSGDDAAIRGLQWAQQTLADAGFTVATSVVPGNPEATIAAQARELRTDLLVMGAYGHSRIRELIVGSTTTALLRSCAIPVLLLR